MKLLILAAGASKDFQGMNRLLIVIDQKTGKTILDQYIEVFNPTEVTIIIGANSADLIMKYPDFNYVYNQSWDRFRSASSLALAPYFEGPVAVIPCDLIFQSGLVPIIRSKLGASKNFVFVWDNENILPRSICMKCNNEGKIVEIMRERNDYTNTFVCTGLFILNDPDTLSKWRYKASRDVDAFFAQSYPLETAELFTSIISQREIVELNTINDYLKFLTE
jgi:choline kinase